MHFAAGDSISSHAYSGLWNGRRDIKSSRNVPGGQATGYQVIKQRFSYIFPPARPSFYDHNSAPKVTIIGSISSSKWF